MNNIKDLLIQTVLPYTMWFCKKTPVSNRGTALVYMKESHTLILLSLINSLWFSLRMKYNFIYAILCKFLRKPYVLSRRFCNVAIVLYLIFGII